MTEWLRALLLRKPRKSRRRGTRQQNGPGGMGADDARGGVSARGHYHRGGCGMTGSEPPRGFGRD